MKERKKENPPKHSVEELMEELEKYHTEDEYDVIHKEIKCILRKDFIKGVAVPLIAFFTSITVLIVQLLLL